MLNDGTPPKPAPIKEPRVRKKGKRLKPEAVRRLMGKRFREEWETICDTVLDLIEDEDAKPTERMAAAKIALEFGFGKAPTQEPPVSDGKPKIKFGDTIPTVEQLKAKHGRKAETTTD
ncbi:hypothetical protein KGP36_01685 [Patescibacteria group bacterium]|nr:hypothetical protein [Patescibacteria group bacterium]